MSFETAGPLAKYYYAAAEDMAYRQEDVSLDMLEFKIANLADIKPRFTEALANSPGVSVIAEHKRMSPSEGEIRPGSSVKDTVEQYQKGGATALSILVQKQHFGGDIQDIAEAREASSLPILRKDFISENYQLYEAKANGADAALLIVGGLAKATLIKLHKEATNIGLDCLVEAHDEKELEMALEIGATLVGINNRDLANPKNVDLDVTKELACLVPEEKVLVAESGYSVKNKLHLRELEDISRVDAVLMGTALMREDDPALALSNWLK